MAVTSSGGPPPERRDASPDAPAEVDVEALLAEREHHLAALNQLDVGLVVLDADLQVLLCNAIAEQTLGLSPDRLDLDRPGALEVVHEDGTPWPVLDRPTIKAVLTGEPTEGTVMGLVRGDATTWTHVTARPLYAPGATTPRAAVGTYRDVTEVRAAELALRESEAHFRLLAENSTDVITRHASDGTILYASPALTDMQGWLPEEIVGRSAVERFHPDDAEAVVEGFRTVLSTRLPQVLRYRTLHRDGHWLWVETVTRPVVGAEGRIAEVQAATRDVSVRVETEQRLSRMALTDSLTGLANRAALIQELEALLARGSTVSLLFLDLDRFKVVNDSLGHSAGDELLRTVAGRLAGTCRDGDLVARLGGDEFVVVAVGLDEPGAVHLAERVQQVVRAPIGVAGHDLVVSASVGIVAAAAASPELDAESLLRDADVSMYRAKAKGRARAVVWDESLGEAGTERLSLEHDLRAALGDAVAANGSGRAGLRVHYQPQVDLRSGRVVGLEALVRWHHPERGLLLPAAFLQVAEDSGLVVALGRRVLATAAEQVARWRELPGAGDLHLAVNLSAQELVSPGQPATTREALAAAGLPPGALTVEVLESVLLDADGDVGAALADLSEAGIALALDDFGTGSSSLLHLRSVPVDVVKVDRTFVDGLGRSRQDEAIVRAVRVLAEDLGLGCVAEGVEEEHQRAWLVEQGVDTAQGFLLHRPMPAEAVTALLTGDAGTERQPGGTGVGG